MENQNLWMFRVSEKWGNRIQYCLDNNLVYCGWNIGLSYKSTKEILEANPEASRMAIKFTYINTNDIIILPMSGGIAIGKVVLKEFREDLDWQDTLNIEWLTKWYSKKDLPSKLQSKLKYRGTFLNLNDFGGAINDIIESNFLTATNSYQNKLREKEEATIVKLAEQLNGRKETKFQDTEFELFILHLFELEYSNYGVVGFKNNGKSEAIDGKDVGFTIDLDEFNINIKVNIQVKQHSDNASFGGLSQIYKSNSADPYVRNILVTSGKITSEMREEAIKLSVLVYGPIEIAKMILSNIDNLDENYFYKLNIYKMVEVI